MKIANYQVEARSDRLYVQSTHTITTLSSAIQAAPREEAAELPEDVLSLSPQAKDTLEGLIIQAKPQNPSQQPGAALARKMASLPRAKSVGTPWAASKDDLKIKLLEMMLSALSGKRFKFNLLKEESFQAQPLNLDLPVQNQARQISFSQTQMHYEYESVNYSASGVVNTADGKSISIDLSLNMSREFASYSQIEARGSFCDPLVINYGGTAASLTQQKYQFDLTCDGVQDSISFAGPGSGFLALDKNGDGVINNGSELFGPQSGNGFYDLRAYDLDGNGWIDESDEVYSRLKVWSRDENGKDQLFTLKELDVGAIFLGDVSTQFSINDPDNVGLGQVRSTSFFLKDSGGAGTVQHIDLSV